MNKKQTEYTTRELADLIGITFAGVLYKARSLGIKPVRSHPSTQGRGKVWAAEDAVKIQNAVKDFRTRSKYAVTRKKAIRS